MGQKADDLDWGSETLVAPRSVEGGRVRDPKAGGVGEADHGQSVACHLLDELVDEEDTLLLLRLRTPEINQSINQSLCER